MCRLLGRIFAEPTLRAAETEAVSINVFLMHHSKCEMSDKRLMFAKPPTCKKVRNEPEDTLNVDGSHTVIVEAKDLAHSPIERCQVLNAEETVRRASEVRTQQRGRDDMAQDVLVSSNDKLHIEQVCKAHKGGEKIYSLSLQSARMSKITNDGLTRSGI